MFLVEGRSKTTDFAWFAWSLCFMIGAIHVAQFLQVFSTLFTYLGLTFLVDFEFSAISTLYLCYATTPYSSFEYKSVHEFILLLLLLLLYAGSIDLILDRCILLI